MENHPDICVWFEINKNSFFLEPKSPIISDNKSIEEETTSEVITKNNQSCSQKDSNEIDLLITDDSYFFRVLSSFKDGCYIFPFFSRGWQYLPFRVFLEASPGIKMTFIDFNEVDFTTSLSLLPSKKSKKTLVKNYSLNLMFSGSLCIIEGTLYYADFYNEGPYTFFELNYF